MVNDFRDKFGSGDYPFAYVQASSAVTQSADIGAIRYQQHYDKPVVNGTIDTTAMIVSYDLGNKSSNVPSNKVQIGERVGLKLARIAPVILYDHNMSLYTGPIIQSAIFDSNAKTISVNFTNLGENDQHGLQLLNTVDCSECCFTRMYFKYLMVKHGIISHQ